MNRFLPALLLGLSCVWCAQAQITIDNFQSNQQACPEDGLPQTPLSGLFENRRVEFYTSDSGCLDIGNGSASISNGFVRLTWSGPVQDLRHLSAFSVAFQSDIDGYVDIGAIDAMGNEFWGRMALNHYAAANRAILFNDHSTALDWSQITAIFVNISANYEPAMISPPQAHESATDNDGDGVLNSNDPNPNSNTRMDFRYLGLPVPAYIPNLILDSGLSLMDSMALCGAYEQAWQFDQCKQLTADQFYGQPELLTEDEYLALIEIVNFQPPRPYHQEDHPKLDDFSENATVNWDSGPLSTPHAMFLERIIDPYDEGSLIEIQDGMVYAAGSLNIDWLGDPIDLSQLSAISVHMIGNMDLSDVSLRAEDINGVMEYGHIQYKEVGESQRLILFAEDKFNGIDWSQITHISLNVTFTEVVIQSIELHFDATDADGDGIFDAVDPFPHSQTFPDLSWHGRPIPGSYFANQLLDDGSTVSDLIGACDDGNPMAWQFQACMDNTVQNLLNQNLIHSSIADEIHALTSSYAPRPYLEYAHPFFDDFSEKALPDEVTWTTPHAIFEERHINGEYFTDMGVLWLAGNISWTSNTPVDLSDLSGLSLHYYRPNTSGWSSIRLEAYDVHGNFADAMSADGPYDTETRLILHTDQGQQSFDWSQVTGLSLFVDSEDGYQSAHLYNIQMHHADIDADGDGILDGVDPQPQSNVEMLFRWRDQYPNIWIPNTLYDNGQTLNDLVHGCTNGPAKPWQFNQCIQTTLQGLVDSGQLTPEEQSAILELTSDYGKPKPEDDFYTATAGQTLMVDAANGVLANDIDLEGDNLEAHLEQGPSTGTLSLFRDGSFHYTPAVGFSGEVSFTYRCWDGSQRVNATVQILVSN